MKVVALPLLVLALACGRTEENSAVKIRQGSPVAARSQGPERVSTVGLVGFGPQGQYTCSAAIIGTATLVTAAHCVPAGAELYAFFGTNLDTAQEGDYIAVDGQTVHPDYHRGPSGLPPHDIAVLHLSRSIPRGFVPAPILPNDELLNANTEVLLAGFGITERGNDSGRLRATPATFVGLDSIGRLQIDDAAKRGACSGDSGGPLFARVNGVYYAAGVLSGGPIPCRGVNTYTSIAQLRDFVNP